MKKQIFALDIGTRSVTGILLEQDGKEYAIKGFHTKEHEERAMLDGQIHDVIQVAEVIQDVKAALETDTAPLKNVYVAAAGRSLITKKASAHISLSSAIAEKEMVRHLELSAVYQAQMALVEETPADSHANYYCVGYSITHYRLDGEKIGSLIDQRGQEAAVEVIATFLPKIVVESLLAALERAGLHMEALTLEPIAAIRVLIPDSMRRLNVALVDIGAGTSDIAITEDGTVSAYGMVPIAGDEITEKISDVYLLDYPLAEAMKRNITKDGQAIVEDILGFETIVPYPEFIEAIQPATELLANSIAKEILQLNGQAPRAVMLIGGGSLTPGLTSLLADKLDLPANRVAVRGIEAIKHLTYMDTLPQGPDYVTPIGIAIAADEKPVHYITVHVNGQAIRMFEMKELTVGDCLVQAGIELGKYYGKPGIGKVIYLNGKEQLLPGSFGSKPIILLNGVPTTAEARIQPNDVIEVKKGTDGTTASSSILDFFPDLQELDVVYQGNPLQLKPVIQVNDKTVDVHYALQDGDNVLVTEIRTAADFLQAYLQETPSTIAVFVNGKQTLLGTGQSASLLINGREAMPAEKLASGDQIESHTYGAQQEDATVEQLLSKLNVDLWQRITVFFDDQPVELKEKRFNVLREETALDLDEPLLDGDAVQLQERGAHTFIFQDVFRYIDLDLTQATGSFEIQVNGTKAGFDTPIFSGDRLEIKWPESSQPISHTFSS